MCFLSCQLSQPSRARSIRESKERGGRDCAELDLIASAPDARGVILLLPHARLAACQDDRRFHLQDQRIKREQPDGRPSLSTISALRLHMHRQSHYLHEAEADLHQQQISSQYDETSTAHTLSIGSRYNFFARAVRALHLAGCIVGG